MINPPKKALALISGGLDSGLAALLIKNQGNGVLDEDAKCIAENSELYTQLGCHACTVQEEMFGSSYQNLNVIDCWYEREKCSKIQYTPTWIINGKEYRGVKSLEELKKLTGCE